jgi:hypothetical protein
MACLHILFASLLVMALRRKRYSEGSLRGMSRYSGLLLLFLRESGLHISVGLWRNRAILFGSTGTCCFTLVDISVEARGFGIALVHFFVDLPL